MDAKKIALLLKVVEYGSINRAGEELGYSHSGLIHILNSMDKEVGFPLLERRYNGVSFSDQGKELEPVLRRILEDDELLIQKAKDIQRRLNHTSLIVGAFPSIASFILPQLLSGFMDEHPEITIKMEISGDISTQLEEDRIDLGIISQDNAGSLDWLSLGKDQYLAVLPRTAGYTEEDTISMDELQKLGLLITGANGKNAINQTFRKLGIDSEGINVSTYDGHTLLSMAEYGMCVTILPSLYRARCPESLIMIPTDPPIIRELGLAAKSFSGLSPAGQKFLNYVRKEIKMGTVISSAPDTRKASKP